MKVKLSGVRRINIKGEYIRLDTLLKLASVTSTGGEAKLLIQDGKIFVNGENCSQRGKKIRQGDIVRCGMEIITVKSCGDADKSVPNNGNDE